MKKWWCSIIFLLLFFSFPLYTAAENPSNDLAPFLEIIDDIKILQTLPLPIRQELHDLKIDDIGFIIDKQLSPEQIVQHVLKEIKEEFTIPIRSLAHTTAVLILIAFLESTRSFTERNKGLAQVFGMASVLFICTTLTQPIIDCIMDTAETITICADFILSLLPVYTGVIVAGGQAATASTTHIFLFWACQVVSQFAADLLVPLIGGYLALCIAGAVSSSIDLSGITSVIKSIFSWALGLLMTLFVGALTLSSLVSAGGDNLGIRTARFMLGSFVPVVGGALSEAFTTAQGCLHLLKTGIGVYGVVISVVIFLPVVARLIAWYATVNFSSSISQILGITKVSLLLKSISSSLGYLLALILCFLLILIVSLTLVLLIGGN